MGGYRPRLAAHRIPSGLTHTMFYRTRLTFHLLRKLLWFPFYLLSSRLVLYLLLIGAGFGVYHEGMHPVEWFGFAIPLVVLFMVFGGVAEFLEPGSRPIRPPRKAPPPPKPTPVPQATPAGTRADHSPDEREVLVRLPIALQRFLAEERAPNAAE